MSPVLGVILGAALTATVTLVIGVLTWRQSRRAQQDTKALDTRKVDLEVFESSVAELRLQVSALREELRCERAAREGAQQRAKQADRRAELAEQRTAEVERQAKALARRTSRSERRVAQLEAAMREQGIAVPDAALGDS